MRIPNTFSALTEVTSATVSYTHLDVYKRQCLCHEHLFGTKECSYRQSLFCTDFFHQKGVEPEMCIRDRNTINRENVKRKIVISANVADRDLRSVVNDIQKRIDTSVQLLSLIHIFS